MGGKEKKNTKKEKEDATERAESWASGGRQVWTGRLLERWGVVVAGSFRSGDDLFVRRNRAAALCYS